MILTFTCDLCGRNNSCDQRPCWYCGGQTETRLIRGKEKIFVKKKPTVEMRGYYNPDVRETL